MNTKNKNSDNYHAEFDIFADEYYSQHKKNLRITGENPEYFSSYKIKDLYLYCKENQIIDNQIFDFGSGIGNSIPFFRNYFPNSILNCGDISSRSIEIAKSRFPGNENHIKIDNQIPLNDNSQDIIFSACVFHHIPHEMHLYWLTELKRICKPDGLLVIFEHNPINLLTLYAVNTCEFDANAKLLTAKKLQNTLEICGWTKVKKEYKLFFPAIIKFLRPDENKL